MYGDERITLGRLRVRPIIPLIPPRGILRKEKMTTGCGIYLCGVFTPASKALSR